MIDLSNTFKQAVELHQAGRIPDAELLYLRVLRLDSRHADAMHLLGVAALQTQRPEEAVGLIRRAIAMNDRQAAYHSNLGAAYRTLGRIDDAARSFRKATQLAPHRPEFHFNLGNACRQLGDLDNAASAFRKALVQKPDYADAHNNLANLLKERGDLLGASEHYVHVIQIDPKHAEAHLNLGLLRLSQHKLEEATELCRQSVELRPDLAEGHNGLGMVYQRQGRLEEAITCYEQAVRLRPDFRDAQNNLGAVLLDQGKVAESLAVLQQLAEMNPSSCEPRINLANALKASGQLTTAIRCLEGILNERPDFAPAHNNLGNCWKEAGDAERSIACYSRGVELKPEFVEARINLALALQNEGETEKALAQYELAMQQDRSPRLQIQAATILPPIYKSTEDLDFWRQRLTQQLTALISENVAVDPTTGPCETTFYLPYQGFNDKDIQMQIGRLHQPMDRLSGRSIRTGSVRRTGKIRLGFISRYLHNHTIGRLMCGGITRLSREEFDVTVLFVDKHEDDISRRLRASADRSLNVSKCIPAAMRAIRELELDILFYTDVGMDPITYSLAHFRLAQIQCATWGHPLTTGLPTIDYFLSSRLFETDDAEDHYSEELVRFESPGIYYFRPESQVGPATRRDFGLTENKHLYGCPQSLFKLHPEFDPIVAEILRRDPQGELVLLSGARPNWNRLLLERLHRSIPDVVDRVRFVPRQTYERFLQLNTVFDVLLDPLHYSGGNTTYEALAFGIPIVTLPSPYLRGRITHGLYRRMKMMDCVVATSEEYVSKAVALATDASYRREIERQIRDSVGSLYEDDEAVTELEQFFRKVMGRS